MSKLTKVFKKKPKAAPIIAAVVPEIKKAVPDLAAKGRKETAARVKRSKGFGTTDEGAILRPGARSAKLLGE